MTTTTSPKRRSPARSKTVAAKAAAASSTLVETLKAPAAAPATKPATKPARKRASAPPPPVEPASEAVPAKRSTPRKKAAAVAVPPAPAEPVEPEAVAEAVEVKKAPAKRARKAAAPVVEAAPAPEPALEPTSPAKKAAGRRKPKAPPAAAPAEPAVPPRYSLGSREDEGVFGDYELLDREQPTAYRLRLLGPMAWRCDCAVHAVQADCEHGEALLSLLPLEQIAQLDAGWPAREAEVWLLEQGGERRLQWVPGLALPAALNELARPPLDEQLRLPAEQAHGWLQALLDAARGEGVPLRVAPEIWAQLGWARDAQARVQRLEPLLQEPGALAAQLKEPLPAYQWEAALFAVCAGRALLADDLGLGQRGAAIAAIALWARHFGVEPALVIAPAGRQEAWRRDIQRLLGEWPASLTLAEQAPSGGRGAKPQLLVVDALDSLDDAGLQALCALDVAQLLLICEHEPLGDARLGRWIDWLDAARRGPVARLAALPADASKKAQREALQTVLLSRRKRELQEQLPAALLQPRWLQPGGPSQPQAALQQLHALVERWQRLRFLGAAEQQQLLQALSLLPPSSRHALSAKAEAVLALQGEWLPAAAARLLVCAQSETLLDSLAQALKVRKLAVQRLRAGTDQDAVLKAWRAEGGSVLLASDAALAAQAGGLGEARVALVHADLPWSGALPEQRLRLACGDAARGVPVAQLLVEGSPDRALLAVQQEGVSFPAWLDAPPAWLGEAQLAELMPALQALLEAL
ncbi:MAG TPA: hypothetical protein VJN44_02535 [Roseateles sp.]|nr:hypothetical protein [Roseateles sp.]